MVGRRFAAPPERHDLTMYQKNFRFANLSIQFESNIPLITSTTMLHFELKCQAWDFLIRISAEHISTNEYQGLGSCIRRGNTFHLRVSEAVYQQITTLQVFSFLPLQDMLFEKNMFVLHASFVMHNGEGILFSGNSGVGKSTQAALWQVHTGARIINGDRVLIYKEKDHFFAAGWFQSGTSGICNNAQCPIKTIVFLEQGLENMVVPMNGLVGFQHLMLQSSYLTDRPEHVEKITSITAELVNDLPILHFVCKKDHTAVERLREYLYG